MRILLFTRWQRMAARVLTAACILNLLVLVSAPFVWAVVHTNNVAFSMGAGSLVLQLFDGNTSDITTYRARVPMGPIPFPGLRLGVNPNPDWDECWSSAKRFQFETKRYPAGDPPFQLGNQLTIRWLAVPCWLPFMISLVLFVMHAMIAITRFSWLICRKCRYELLYNVTGNCPECGTPIPPEQIEKIKQAETATSGAG